MRALYELSQVVLEVFVLELANLGDVPFAQLLICQNKSEDYDEELEHTLAATDGERVVSLE